MVEKSLCSTCRTLVAVSEHGVCELCVEDNRTPDNYPTFSWLAPGPPSEEKFVVRSSGSSVDLVFDGQLDGFMRDATTEFFVRRFNEGEARRAAARAMEGFRPLDWLQAGAFERGDTVSLGEDGRVTPGRSVRDGGFEQLVARVDGGEDMAGLAADLRALRDDVRAVTVDNDRVMEGLRAQFAAAQRLARDFGQPVQEPVCAPVDEAVSEFVVTSEAGPEPICTVRVNADLTLRPVAEWTAEDWSAHERLVADAGVTTNDDVVGLFSRVARHTVRGFRALCRGYGSLLGAVLGYCGDLIALLEAVDSLARETALPADFARVALGKVEFANVDPSFFLRRAWRDQQVSSDEHCFPCWLLSE